MSRNNFKQINLINILVFFQIFKNIYNNGFDVDLLIKKIC
jgi:hypothetical protein